MPRAIGFTGFTELKIEIARGRGTIRFFAPPDVLTEDATWAAVLEAFIRAGTDALTALGGAVELGALEEAVGALQSARQVVAFGAGPSATVATDAAFRLRAVDVTTIGISDYLSAMIAVRLLGPGDVVIAITSTGRTATMLAIADAASSAGASLIAVISQYGTPLGSLADIALVANGGFGSSPRLKYFIRALLIEGLRVWSDICAGRRPAPSPVLLADRSRSRLLGLIATNASQPCLSFSLTGGWSSPPPWPP